MPFATDKIQQDAERLAYETHREELAKVRHAARSEYLKNRTGGNRGVNIITGMENPTAVVLEACTAQQCTRKYPLSPAAVSWPGHPHVFGWPARKWLFSVRGAVARGVARCWRRLDLGLRLRA